jgi:hypothetical protein
MSTELQSTALFDICKICKINPFYKKTLKEKYNDGAAAEMGGGRGGGNELESSVPALKWHNNHIWDGNGDPKPNLRRIEQ